ncbi:MAG: hypothetical protein R3263_05000 [Myxococcota bacterium]|nr:hypothetical protein [Myxococcota bacterium]
MTGRDDARRARRILLLVAFGLLALLVGMPKPWDLASGPGFPSTRARSLFDTVMAATFWVALVDLLLCLLFAAAAPLWARPLGRTDGGPAPPPRVGRVFVLLLAAASLLAVGLRAPLASRSLWWDEAWSVKRTLGGWPSADPAEPGEVAYKELPWSRPVWHYRKPTNHVLYNVTARATVEAWRVLTGRGPHAFDELVFRLPALAASALAVAGTGVLLWRWGLPRAGVAAAFLLAIHPWYLRYGAEGRAYSLAALLSVALALALTEALRTGRWRAWLASGAALFLLLWNQPAGIYLATTAGLGTLVALARRPVPWRDRATLAMRFGASAAFAAMAFLLVMAPNIAQALSWDDVVQSRSLIDAGRIEELWTLAVTGIPPHPQPLTEGNGLFPSVEAMRQDHPWVGPLLFLVLPVLAAAGLVRLLVDRRSSPWIVLGLLLSVPLLLEITHLRRMYYYPRFLIHAAVLFAILAAAGLETLLASLPAPPRWRRALVPAGLALGLGCYQLGVAPQTGVLLTRPIAPMRDVGEFLAERVRERPGGTHVVGYGIGGSMVRLYAPWVVRVDSYGQLQREIRQARAEGRRLYVFYGYAGHNRRDRQGGFLLLDDPQLFEEVARFHGVEGQFTYRVLRFREPHASDGEVRG